MSQVGQFIQEAQKVVGTPSGPQDGPKVAFPTDLKLTGDQEKKMIEHAFARMDAIGKEQGRDQTLQPMWWMNNSAAVNQTLASQGFGVIGDTFMGKRSRYDATFLNDVSWRPYTMGPNTIFSSSNIPTPVVRRVCRQMIAKAKDAFLGADPWFSITPQPVPKPEDEPDEVEEEADDKTERVQAFCRFKMEESGSKKDKGRAIQRALVLGECPVKTIYVVRDQIFNVEAQVLVSVDNQPVRGQDGNYITQEDTWQDAEDGQGTQVLSRDKVTPHPNPLAPMWSKVPLNRRQVLFEGAKSEPIYFKDFLCPMTAPDVQQADCIVHLYDKNVMEFVDLVVKRGMVGDDTESRLGAAQKIVTLVQALAQNDSTPKAAVSAELRPGENFQTAPITNTAGSPLAEFAEFYMWFDANGDGVAENIMLIADRKTRMPVYYDHVANITTDGLRPIEIVRVNPVEGRWYGMGIMELFESYGTIIDLLVNRWNFSQSRAGRVDFWRPTDTLEGDRDPNLKMNYGMSYTAKPNADPEKILKSVYLSDIKFEQVQTMTQFFIQLLMNESGVSTANDDQAAGMQSAKLATGIIDMQKSGDELFRPLIQDLTDPLAKIVAREVDVTLANMNPIEAYTYLQGDTHGIDQITPDDVRGMKYKVRIELTMHKEQELIMMSAQASALVEKFYLLPPEVQPHVASFYRRQIRALDPRCDVDNVIKPIVPPPPSPEPTKSGINLTIKWETLSDEEKKVFASKIGVEEPEEAPPADRPLSSSKKPKKSGGSTVKLGRVEQGGARAAAPSQLIQKHAQPTGASAPGGTPAAA